MRTSELCLISPPSHKASRKVSLKSLKNYPLILPGNPRAIKLSLDRAAEHSATVNAVHHVEGIANTLELVRQGHGHTILPKDVILEHPLATKLSIVPFDPALTSTLAVAVCTKRRLTDLCEQTVQIIKDAVSDSHAKGRPAARRSVKGHGRAPKPPRM